VKAGIAPHQLWPADPRDLDGVVSNAALAEHLGFDHVIVGSHVLAGDLGVTLDAIVLLSAIAGATSRARIVASVLIAPLNHPYVLAHQAASLDRLSGGRFVLGVGTGWDTREFAALGIPFGERGRRADQNLAVMTSLWRPEPGRPAIGVSPLTPGGPPVWVGGHSDAALRRALRYGAAWHGSGEDPATVVDVRKRLEVLAGHAPTGLELTSVVFVLPTGFKQAAELPFQPISGERAVEELSRLAEAGLAACSIWLPVTAAALPDAMTWVAEEIIPAV
jgi:alkanesulfonate monooxygenase SsuD/methylene tetrahydromethanopterin reductase-like flavin-dependent oxidoreductase (luciferase family)